MAAKAIAAMVSASGSYPAMLSCPKR